MIIRPIVEEVIDTRDFIELKLTPSEASMLRTIATYLAIERGQTTREAIILLGRPEIQHLFDDIRNGLRDLTKVYTPMTDIEVKPPEPKPAPKPVRAKNPFNKE